MLEERLNLRPPGLELIWKGKMICLHPLLCWHIFKTLLLSFAHTWVIYGNKGDITVHHVIIPELVPRRAHRLTQKTLVENRRQEMTVCTTQMHQAVGADGEAPPPTQEHTRKAAPPSTGASPSTAQTSLAVRLTAYSACSSENKTTWTFLR